jgi:hypothetical protein
MTQACPCATYRRQRATPTRGRPCVTTSLGNFIRRGTRCRSPGRDRSGIGTAESCSAGSEQPVCGLIPFDARSMRQTGEEGPGCRTVSSQVLHSWCWSRGWRSCARRTPCSRPCCGVGGPSRSLGGCGSTRSRGSQISELMAEQDLVVSRARASGATCSTPSSTGAAVIHPSPRAPHPQLLQQF